MKWYTRPVDQGQIVEVSYAYNHDQTAYMRVHDRSDNTFEYYKGDIDWDREPEGFDYERAPCVDEWVLCQEPIEN